MLRIKGGIARMGNLPEIGEPIQLVINADQHPEIFMSEGFATNEVEHVLLMTDAEMRMFEDAVKEKDTLATPVPVDALEIIEVFLMFHKKIGVTGIFGEQSKGERAMELARVWAQNRGVHIPDDLLKGETGTDPGVDAQ